MAAGQPSVTIRLVSNRVPAVQARVHEVIAAQVKTSTLEIQAKAQAVVPVRTGLLRRSIHSVFTADGLTGTVGPSASYGAAVEFGTRHMGARPYMRPAAALVLPRFVDQVRDILRGMR